jgi:SAM-dependent methyltransferase
MAVTTATIARMRGTVARHLRRGFVRVVFAQPGGEGEGEEIVEGTGKPPGETELRELLRRATVAAKAGHVKQTWIIDGRTRLVVDARHGAGKLVTLDDERADKMMGGKDRGARPDRSADLLRTIGIMNADGTVSTKHAKKYKQITHFMELCRPVWEAITRRRTPTAEDPVRVVDLGSGNGYLTFVMAEALRIAEIPARIHGIDVRADVVDRANERAKSLGWSELTFSRAAIDDAAITDLVGGTPDLLVALHACDTASDDALALGIQLGVATMLVAPCCQHELAAQLSPTSTDALSPALASQGLLRHDFAATLTDALRIDMLDAMGWSVDTLEFVGDTHTPKNLLIRATLRGRVLDGTRLDRIRERCATLGVEPRLLVRLSHQRAT